PAPWLTGTAAATVAALAAHEALAAADPGGDPRTRGGILVVALADLDVTDHRFLPDPACPVCGGLPEDSAAGARLRPGPRPKRAPDDYRVGSVDLDRLRRTYVDQEVGLVRALGHGTEAGLVVARAPLCMPGGGHEESGWGRARDSRTARQVALLEALERYGGARPGGRRTAVHAPYSAVAADAVDPRSFGLHAPEQRAEPGHRFGRYDEDEPRHWVWAHSFGRDRPVLVPESLGYYRSRLLHPDDPPLAYEASNGCALGGCVEEAALYGLLEVAERDAFLLTWHARLPAPRIDLATWPDPLAGLLAAEIDRELGYAVHVFDITPEHGVPCVWALAVDPGGGSAGRPATASAAGAHLDPRQAVLSALAELGPILAHLVRSYPEQAGRAAAMAADPSLVTEMEDHALLHGHPDTLERFDFLLRPPAGTGPPRRPDPPRPRADLRDDLLGAVDRFAAAGLDVLVLDQTTPEHRAGGLACVKVLVPGTLPMTFGHAHRRLSGLPRLRTVPRLLGHPEPAGISTLPHPFP
ncbi:MAG: TOMM biosynthesis cyclodehydratase (protein C) / TOMM biosynthesis docking scaffold (protein D), partial [uncultured Corynebacteriales bacterium]